MASASYQKNETMKAENRIFTIILGYCAILWLANWSLSPEYAREVGLKASGLDMRGLGALTGLVASVVLARRIWQVTRAILDARIRISRSIRLWGVMELPLAALAAGIGHHVPVFRGC